MRWIVEISVLCIAMVMSLNGPGRSHLHTTQQGVRSCGEAVSSVKGSSGRTKEGKGRRRECVYNLASMSA